MNHYLNFQNGRSQFQLANSSGSIDNSNPLPVNIGSANVTLGSGAINITFSSGTFALLSGSTSIYNSSGQISQSNPFPITGNVYLTSGEIHITSGNINATINSGNINATINSGNITVNSGNINATITSGSITILNSGSPVSPINPLPVSISSGSVNENGIPIQFAKGLTDAFGRLRVSNPFTIFDSQQRYKQNNKFNYSTTTGGSTQYDQNSSLVNMNTSLASGAQVICESKTVMPYQPGKSLLIYQTFTMSSSQPNQRQRVGYFGQQNGIYFEVDGESAYFVKRTSISGSTNEYRIPQNLWSDDKLNGAGPSRYSITNFSSSIILFIDIEWLGVGDVRVGFILNGQYVTCHTFKHTPVGGSPISGTYMTTASLPLRYEITNTGPVTFSGNLKKICTSVISEGGYEGSSTRNNIDLGTSEKNLSLANTLYPIMSIRLASGRLDSIVVPSDVSAIITSNQDVYYNMVVNGTMSGASWMTHPSGNVQYDMSATSIASGTGTQIVGGYINKQGAIEISGINNFNYQIGRTIDGTSDVLTLCMQPVSANTKILADMSWFEIV